MPAAQKESVMDRKTTWMQYAEAEERTHLHTAALKKLVTDGSIRKKPWYLPPFGLDLLRRDDIETYENRSARKR